MIPAALAVCELRELLAGLNDDQVRAVAAVAARYLGETRWVTSEYAELVLRPEEHAEYSLRRETCMLITGGGQ